MKRTIVVGLMVALTALLACNKDSGAGSGGSGGSAAAGGGDIGVKECDDYMKKWNDCYKDPAVKAAAKPGLDQTVAAWKQAASTPQGKAGLATSCKMMLDNFPSAACK
ncbi:MAG TPA: hypothetical protein VGL81_04380 [Polyangiaceae bacterium]|jgi:hypothetical protein